MAKDFDAQKHLETVATEYIDRMMDCFGEISDYIMEVNPDKKTAEEIRDEIYNLLKKYQFKP